MTKPYQHLDETHTAHPEDKPNIEVVVIVHAGWTTTSEESQLGIITDSKRKLITHETSDREQTDCVCVFKFNCFNLPAALIEEG